MADPIPPEDDIRKTDLWKRIDYNRDVVESHKGEVLFKLQTVIDELKTQVDHLNSEHSLLMQKKMSEVENWLGSFRSNQNKTLSDTINEIHSIFKKNLGDFESRLKELRESISTIVAGESSELFAEAERRIARLEEGFASFTSNVNEAISKYQVETRTKVGSLKSKVEVVVSRLRDAFQDL